MTTRWMIAVFAMSLSCGTSEGSGVADPNNGDTAAERRRAATLVAFRNDHLEAAFPRLERGGRAGSTESDDQDIGLLVPVDVGLVIDNEWRFHGGMPVRVVRFHLRRFLMILIRI